MFVSWLRLVGLMVVSAWLVAGCGGAKKIDVGGTCILNSDCNGSLLCTMGKCHDACHTSADCLAGKSCVKTDDTTFCQLPDEAFCSPALPCGGTFVCASDQHCRAPCQSRTACTSEQVCVSGVCAAPAELDSNNQLPQGGLGAVAGTCAAGPDGWCWSIYSNPLTTAAWVAPLSDTGAHAYLTAEPGNVGTAGVGFRFAADRPLIDLSRFDRIIFTATASSSFRLPIGENHTVGCWAQFSGSGTRTTYTFEFSKCTLWSTDTRASPFTFARVDELDWQTIWGTASSLDIEIVPDILFCLGTQCTANPQSP
ncbi:MAG TPA: hypothetical protein VJ860_05160 [Polyangia bacterium]|nr:hypothetical protein [Polyangia bacterium]